MFANIHLRAVYRHVTNDGHRGNPHPKRRPHAGRIAPLNARFRVAIARMKFSRALDKRAVMRAAGSVGGDDEVAAIQGNCGRRVDRFAPRAGFDVPLVGVKRCAVELVSPNQVIPRRRRGPQSQRQQPNKHEDFKHYLHCDCLAILFDISHADVNVLSAGFLVAMDRQNIS